MKKIILISMMLSTQGYAMPVGMNLHNIDYSKVLSNFDKVDSNYLLIVAFSISFISLVCVFAHQKINEVKSSKTISLKDKNE